MKKSAISIQRDGSGPTAQRSDQNSAVRCWEGKVGDVPSMLSGFPLFEKKALCATVVTALIPPDR